MKESIRYTYLFIVLTGLILSGSAITAYAVTGPGQAWLYYRVISLSPQTPSAGFQVKITLTTATFNNPYTNIRSDGNDLRFYDGSNNACSYWIESFANNGNSYIWVKVPLASTGSLYMFYGNSSASSLFSNGSTTFDFFDDFTTSGLPGWSQSVSSPNTITQSGSQVTLTNNNGGNVYLSNTSAFTPSSSSWLLETKNYETAYFRNRFYATNSSGGMSPPGWDYGYFYFQTTYSPGAFSISATLWNSTWTANTLLSATTVYLTRWQITDGSTYNWYTYNYSNYLTGGAAIDSRTATTASTIRYITYGVTEAAGTSIVIDWVRVRQYAASEPAGTFGSQVATVQVSVTAHTDASCYRQPSGSATATAVTGTSPYSYSWNTTPTQTTSVATNLPAGTYSVTVTDNIGITATSSITINQSNPVTATVSSPQNISCYGGYDGKLTITAGGGTPNYYFSIDNGASWYPSSGGGIAGPHEFTGLGATDPPTTIYRARVRDSNGCLSPLMP